MLIKGFPPHGNKPILDDWNKVACSRQLSKVAKTSDHHGEENFLPYNPSLLMTKTIVVHLTGDMLKYFWKESKE